MTMEPAATATLIISKIKNAMEVVKSWRQNRDRKITLGLLNKSRNEQETNHQGITGNTTGLTFAIGQETLKEAIGRIDACFASYETVLRSNEFYPGDIDKAAKNLIACINIELEKLEGMDKESTEGMIKNYWMDYISNEP